MPDRTPGRLHRAVCPGSFDPVTNGHLDIIERSAKLFDEVVVAVGVNKSKSRLFSPDERIEMLTQACAGWDNVRVDGFTGLLTDFCLEHDIDAIVKGLRAVSDFHVRRRRDRPGAGVRAGAAREAAGRPRRSSVTPGPYPSVLPLHPLDGYDSVVLFSVRTGVTS
jgi:cytidyltransferase-like protein